MHVVLHRVSIRTLCEPSWLCAGWGPVGDVDAASFRPALKAQRDTQSSEHGLVTTKEHHGFNSRCSGVERNVLFLGDPDPVKQHGKLSGKCNDGTVACLLASTRNQAQAPLS
jgi:hypothetical protein